MKRILISILMVLTLITIFVLPASAAVEQSTDAEVTVLEVVSITLTGAIDFGSIMPPVAEQGATGQTDGDPAITITVEPETNVNVDIGIQGAITEGSLALSNWLYSTLFDKSDIDGLTGSYAGVYTNVGIGDNDFYHWITVPGGTPAGSHTVSVSYKAVETGTGF